MTEHPNSRHHRHAMRIRLLRSKGWSVIAIRKVLGISRQEYLAAFEVLKRRAG